MQKEQSLSAFHGDDKIKQKYVKRMEDHIKADQLYYLNREGFGEAGRGILVHLSSTPSYRKALC